jgi:hypothetical protein
VNDSTTITRTWEDPTAFADASTETLGVTRGSVLADHHPHLARPANRRHQRDRIAGTTVNRSGRNIGVPTDRSR